MIIDGEELKLKCKKCGHKYTHVLGYGPVSPTPWLRVIKLKENPPVCPRCGSSHWEYRNFWKRFF